MSKLSNCFLHWIYSPNDFDNWDTWLNDFKVYPETYAVRRLSVYFLFGKYSKTKCETCVNLAFLRQKSNICRWNSCAGPGFFQMLRWFIRLCSKFWRQKFRFEPRSDWLRIWWETFKPDNEISDPKLAQISTFLRPWLKGLIRIKIMCFEWALACLIIEWHGVIVQRQSTVDNENTFDSNWRWAESQTPHSSVTEQGYFL